jgi:thymidylate synthase (FAD)
MNNKNTVELIGHYGGDNTHSLSAWTSTSRDLTPDKEVRIPDLLKKLSAEEHSTPFEKSMLHFLVTTDIASHIHIIKHRIGVSVNAESARYKELKEDKYYLPEDFDVPTDDVYINEERADTWKHALQLYTEQGNQLYHNCLKDLTPILGRKRAKESARYFKTYNSQITADIAFNWTSFVHFYKLRADDHAQLEIQEIAKKMLQLIKEIPGNPFEYSIKAFGL